MLFSDAADFAISATVLVILVVAARFIYTRKYGSMVHVSERKEITTFTNAGASLTYNNIVKATEDFSSRNRIVGGAFGAIYKAEVSPGFTVAVTRFESVIGVQQVHAEIKFLGTIRHRNLVTLIGYHASETEMFLVYDHLPRGNLEKLIQEKSARPLCWKELYKIARDVADTLAYLHEARIVHRDVKPGSGLLDDDPNAFLCGFGLYWLLDDSEKHASLGYLGPEFAMTWRVSEKSDVYSYGVVLLELISDKRALGASFLTHGDDFNIVLWARMLLRQGEASEVFTSELWDSGPRDDLTEVLQLAVKCTLDTLSDRPTMKNVVHHLKQLRRVC